MMNAVFLLGMSIDEVLKACPELVRQELDLRDDEDEIQEAATTAYARIWWGVCE